MIKVVAASVLALGLAGCVSQQQIEQAAIDKDDRECRSYGVQPGTQAYVSCRMNLRQARASEEVANKYTNAYMGAVGMRMLSGY